MNAAFLCEDCDLETAIFERMDDLKSGEAFWDSNLSP